MEFTEELKVFLWAMTPLGELRAAIPLGLTVYKLSPAAAYFFAVLGNLAAVFLVLCFLTAFKKWSSGRIYFFNRFFAWLLDRTKKNHQTRIEKYGVYFLPLFVAIPLPITGGWTASLIAFVFDVPFKKAFPLISLGILAAGAIVLFSSRLGIIMHRYFGWQILAGAVLFSALAYWFYKRIWQKQTRSLAP